MAANPRCWFQCADCKARFMDHRAATGRRSRLRCRACGSLAIEPSPPAKKNLVDGMDAKRQADPDR